MGCKQFFRLGAGAAMAAALVLAGRTAALARPRAAPTGWWAPTTARARATATTSAPSTAPSSSAAPAATPTNAVAPTATLTPKTAPPDDCTATTPKTPACGLTKLAASPTPRPPQGEAVTHWLPSRSHRVGAGHVRCQGSVVRRLRHRFKAARTQAVRARVSSWVCRTSTRLFPLGGDLATRGSLWSGPRIPARSAGPTPRAWPFDCLPGESACRS